MRVIFDKDLQKDVGFTAPAANTHTVTAGATTSVFTNTSFDGSTGSSAYTIGDIVAVLKAQGMLAP